MRGQTSLQRKDSGNCKGTWDHEFWVLGGFGRKMGETGASLLKGMTQERDRELMCERGRRSFC